MYLFNGINSATIILCQNKFLPRATAIVAISPRQTEKSKNRNPYWSQVCIHMVTVLVCQKRWWRIESSIWSSGTSPTPGLRRRLTAKQYYCFTNNFKLLNLIRKCQAVLVPFIYVRVVYIRGRVIIWLPHSPRAVVIRVNTRYSNSAKTDVILGTR